MAHLHVERARYDIRDEDVGDPSRPIRNPSQNRGVPVVEHAKSCHLQPPVPREGVSPLWRGDGADKVGVGKAVEVKSS